MFGQVIAGWEQARAQPHQLPAEIHAHPGREREDREREREMTRERERESEKGGEMGEWRENVLERREANRERRENRRGEGSGRKER